MIEKQKIKRGISRKVKYTVAGKLGERSTFTIMNMTTITVVFPKWWNLLIKNKFLKPNEVEFNFRLLKNKLEVIGLELVSYSLYEEEAYIVIKSFIDGSPVDAKITLKSDLRLFNKSMKEFYSDFKERTVLLRNYTFVNGKVRFTPTGPRKRPNSFPNAKDDKLSLNKDNYQYPRNEGATLA